MTRIHWLELSKGPDWYLFLYDEHEASAPALLDVFKRFAGDPKLSFSWHDASQFARLAREGLPQERIPMEPHDKTIEANARAIAEQLAPQSLFADFGLSLLIPLLTTFLPGILKGCFPETPTAGSVKERVTSQYNPETGEYDPRVVNQLARHAIRADQHRRKQEGHRGRKGKLSNPQAKAIARATLDNARTADDQTVEMLAASCMVSSADPLTE